MILHNTALFVINFLRRFVLVDDALRRVAWIAMGRAKKMKL